MPISRITITGLHSRPKTFRLGTILRILVKYGAGRDDLTKIQRDLVTKRSAKFNTYNLSVPDKIWSETKP